MNVYDFDNTIYDGDSSIEFYLYCLFRHPKVLLSLPKQIMGLNRFLFAKGNKTEFKQSFFSFVTKLNDIDSDIENFWMRNAGKIKRFYLDRKRDSDIVISASPRFLLEPICDSLGIRLIATEIDKNSGIISGENCSGREKVRRFEETYGGHVNEFYSDSYSDLPMTFKAKRSFMVSGNNIKDWC